MIFNAYFQFFIEIFYVLLSCKLVISFSTFSIFILHVKMVNHWEGHVGFHYIEHQLKENIFDQLSAFYKAFIKFSKNSTHLKLVSDNFCGIAQP